MKRKTKVSNNCGEKQMTKGAEVLDITDTSIPCGFYLPTIITKQ